MKKLIIACVLAACVLCGCQAVEEPAATYNGYTAEEYEAVYGEPVIPGTMTDQIYQRWQELKAEGLDDETIYQIVVMGVEQ